MQPVNHSYSLHYFHHLFCLLFIIEGHFLCIFIYKVQIIIQITLFIHKNPRNSVEIFISISWMKKYEEDFQWKKCLNFVSGFSVIYLEVFYSFIEKPAILYDISVSVSNTQTSSNSIECQLSLYLINV